MADKYLLVWNHETLLAQFTLGNVKLTYMSMMYKILCSYWFVHTILLVGLRYMKCRFTWVTCL